MAWSVAGVAAVLIALAWVVTRLRGPSSEETDRLRRLALGDGRERPLPSLTRPPRAPEIHPPEPDDFEERMERLGWKGAIRSWIEDLASPEAGARSRAEEILIDLAEDDRDVIAHVVVTLEDPERADAAESILWHLDSRAIPALEAWGLAGEGARRRDELLSGLRGAA